MSNNGYILSLLQKNETIDRVYVINLAHRLDRRYFMEGHLETIGVPREKIHIFEAKNGNDYESPNAVIKAAIADGFEEFKNRNNRKARTQLAYHWNWCKILREIIELNLVALILLDDRMLIVDWNTLSINVRSLRFRQLDVLQLDYIVHQRDLGNKNIIYESLNDNIGKGIGGHGDYGTIVTPSGAQRILDAIFDDQDTEGMFFIWKEAHTNPEGLYHFIVPLLMVAPTGLKNDLYHFNEGHLNEEKER